MELILDFLAQFAKQLQSPTLSFLIGGFLIGASGSKLSIPGPIYQFVVFVLLIKIGMKGGVEIRSANLAEMLLPAAITVIIGIAIVLIGSAIFRRLPGVKAADGYATAGLLLKRAYKVPHSPLLYSACSSAYWGAPSPCSRVFTSPCFGVFYRSSC